MAQSNMHEWKIILSCTVAFSMLLSSCGNKPTESPPIVIQPNPVSGISENNGTYVNILINSVEFTGAVSNSGDTGNLQLIVVASDDLGHSDALICPYNAVIQVHQGDKKKPCQAGLTYPKNTLQGNLNIVLIAMDIKNQSDLADIGTNVITSGLSTGLGIAIQGTSAMTPQLAIGLIALSTIIGYAGTKTQEYFEKNYVIGSQSFTMASPYNWNNGQPISAPAENKQLIFNFIVQESSTASGQIIGDVPTISTVEIVTDPTSAPTITQQASSDGPYNGWVICWHGRDGYEYLIAYPENEANQGINLNFNLTNTQGRQIEVANDSLKMCLINGEWYGYPDPNPWFPTVSYFKLGDREILVCSDTPDCQGSHWTMLPEKYYPSNAPALQPLINKTIHIIAFKPAQ